ncbi:acyl-CoA N-acyltransferase [Echria macrotheca]|uniref:Acyl-CoA N-acyltransferase n=1 Tax=Echria macrotheca TaxID=438768 RepID=A0AAJ0BG53_9PEZI|nr:acyl-CoA N-acyltransferase [Echria macrotheca]
MALRIVFIPPPGPSVEGYNRTLRAAAQPPSVPISTPFRQSMSIREAVFVDEQKIPLELEFDDHDPLSFHFLALLPGDRGEEEVPVGTVRILPVHVGNAPAIDGGRACIKIGRLAVLKGYRGLGVSRKLVEEAMRWAAENPGALGENWEGWVLVHAQTEVEGLYVRMGFVRDEGAEPWVEDGILHVALWRKLDVAE